MNLGYVLTASCCLFALGVFALFYSAAVLAGRADRANDELAAKLHERELASGEDKWKARVGK